MNDLESRVFQYIDDNQSLSIQLLSKLIQQKSIQGNESGAQKVLIDYLNKLPFQVDIWDIDPEKIRSSPYFISTRQNWKNCPNIAAVLKGKGGGKSLILNGHIDVVPEGEREKWTVDPYSAVVRDGKMFGRGTTDMKGGSTALLMALEAIIKCGVKLKGDVIFESVIEEESGGAGTLSSVLRGYTADAALIPEPTKMKLFIKQQGSMWFRITIPGRSAHGGTRYEGVSAIEKAWIIHQAIQDLENRRNQRVNDPLFNKIPIPLPINVGKLNSGNWPSSVPDQAVLEGRIGVGPEETLENAKNELQSVLESVCEEDSWLKENPAKLEIFGGQWIPNSVDNNHELVTVLDRKFPEIYDRNMMIEASPWGTDAGILGTVGGIPTLVIGPGETKMAHYPDEYIDLNEMVLAAKLFASVILEWSGVAG